MAGIFRLDGAPPDRAALERMGRALVHRGPDDAGLELLGPCGLVHRRLSILDVSSAGRQPMADASGRYHVSYNGELYNYLELRAELEGLGYAFKTGTDTEVLLAAFHRWGEDCFPRFNGMWAVALYDAVERRLVLSRDRLGVKPLCLARDGARVLFASEAKALLAAEPGLARVDLRSVARFLEGRHDVYDERSFFEGIERLPAATVLTLYENGRSRSAKYWRFEPLRRPIAVSSGEAAERTRALLTDAVRLRFRSDVPVGTCLSGGLDSSSIVSIAVRSLGLRPRAFSVLYRDPAYAEGEYVDEVERELGIDCARAFPDASDLPEVMERATYHQEQPTSAPGIYSQWHVMKLAAPSVRVLLDGQGGDELFGGYFGYYLARTRALLRKGRVLSALSARGEMKRLAGFDPVLKVLRPPRLPGTGLAAPSLSRLIEDERAAWAPPSLTGDAFTDALWDHTTRSSLPALLHFEDRASMAFSIEARVPFLDYRLVEWAFSISPELKLEGARTKAVLREAMRGVLPERVRERQDKKGYPTPFSTWARADRGWLRELVESPRGLSDRARASALLAEHQAGRADHGFKLFQLATLELFCRRFLDGPFVAS